MTPTYNKQLKHNLICRFYCPVSYIKLSSARTGFAIMNQNKVVYYYVFVPYIICLCVVTMHIDNYWLLNVHVDTSVVKYLVMIYSSVVHITCPLMKMGNIYMIARYSQTKRIQNCKDRQGTRYIV